MDDKTERLSVYAAGVFCSLTAWIFPLVYSVSEMDYPWPIKIMLWLLGMVVLGTGSWAGVGMAIGLVAWSVLTP